MLRKIFVLFGLSLASHAWAAELAEAPAIKPQDSWTYLNTVENKTGWHQNRTDLTVLRTGATENLISIKPIGSNVAGREQLMGSDWSRFRSVNGVETVINQPMKFPLTSGKSWQIDYVENNPNREHKSEHFHSNYKVDGWEEITVPAGTFRAIKIEADGNWVAEIAPAIANGSGTRVDGQGATIVTQTNRITQHTVSGRLYKAFWYAPEVKRFIKGVEEYYSAGGERTERYTEELEAFRPAS